MSLFWWGCSSLGIKIIKGERGSGFLSQVVPFQKPLYQQGRPKRSRQQHRPNKFFCPCRSAPELCTRLWALTFQVEGKVRKQPGTSHGKCRPPSSECWVRLCISRLLCCVNEPSCPKSLASLFSACAHPLCHALPSPSLLRALHKQSNTSGCAAVFLSTVYGLRSTVYRLL